MARNQARLEYREEQEILDFILKPIFGKKLISSQQEKSLWVHHPEWSPKGFEASIDNYYEVLQVDGKILYLCIDLHGTWHTKHKVQNWDSNKRLALEWCGYTYIELRNYPLAEEVPSLYQLVPIFKKLRVKSAVLYGEQKVAILMQQYDVLLEKATREVLQQMTLQLTTNRPRNITPSEATIPS